MQSMDEIYQNHAKTVYRYLLTLTHDKNLAEELMQETFYQAIRCSNQFDYSCKVSTWLCAIAKKQLATYRRKHPPMEDWEENCDTWIPSAETDALSMMNHVELMEKLHGCPEPFREILYLRLFGNLSFKEIGEVFDKTENWARVTYYRGKEKLREELELDGK